MEQLNSELTSQCESTRQLESKLLDTETKYTEKAQQCEQISMQMDQVKKEVQEREATLSHKERIVNKSVMYVKMRYQMFIKEV